MNFTKLFDAFFECIKEFVFFIMGFMCFVEISQNIH